MDTIISSLEAAAALFVALGLWLLFLSFVRRRSGCRAGKDPLEFMAHGCAGCKGDGMCRSQQSQRSAETKDARTAGGSAGPRG